MTPLHSWTKEEAQKIRKKAYKFFLKGGHLWRLPKRIGGAPLRVIGKREDRTKLVSEFHNSLWAGHTGVWATFSKHKERYWWPNFYKDVAGYVETCETCQLHSNI
jgi:hypothetical protein